MLAVINTIASPHTPLIPKKNNKTITASTNVASPLTRPSLPKCPVKVFSFSSFFRYPLI